LCVLILGR